MAPRLGMHCHCKPPVVSHEVSHVISACALTSLEQRAYAMVNTLPALRPSCDLRGLLPDTPSLLECVKAGLCSLVGSNGVVVAKKE